MNPSRRLALLVSAFLVGWLAAGARAAPPDAAARPDLEKQVRALVRQLGDDEFQKREEK